MVWWLRALAWLEAHTYGQVYCPRCKELNRITTLRREKLNQKWPVHKATAWRQWWCEGGENRKRTEMRVEIQMETDKNVGM